MFFFFFLKKILPNKGLISPDEDVYGDFTVPITIDVLFSIRLRWGEMANCVSGWIWAPCEWGDGRGRAGVGVSEQQLSFSSDMSCVARTLRLKRNTGNEQTLHIRYGNQPVHLELDVVFPPATNYLPAPILLKFLPWWPLLIFFP